MVLEKFYSTKEVGKILGIPPATLSQAIWNDKMDAPIKHGRSYAWTKANIEQASWRLLHKMPNLPEQQPQVAKKKLLS